MGLLKWLLLDFLIRSRGLPHTFIIYVKALIIVQGNRNA